MIRELDMTASWKKDWKYRVFCKQNTAKYKVARLQLGPIDRCHTIATSWIGNGSNQIWRVLLTDIQARNRTKFSSRQKSNLPYFQSQHWFFFSSKNPWELSDIMTVCMLTDDITCWKSIPFFSGHCYFNYTRI